MLQEKLFLRTRRKRIYFDWISLGTIGVLASIGLLFVWSATYKPDIPYSLFFKKQLFGVIFGFIIYLVCTFSDYRPIMRWGYFFYFIIIALLIFTIIKGTIGMGAQRWINFGLIKIQASELAKLFFPSLISYYLYTENESFIFKNKDFILMLLMLLMSTLLILKQPDLGTAIILLSLGLICIWLAGLNKRWFFYGTVILLLCAPLGWYVLKPYQRNRIAVFLGKGQPLKERYQIEQSTIAIGSGGIIGKGFLHGTQNKLQFLPECRTDFIFSVICEERGLLGALFVVLLYILLFARLFLRIVQLPTSWAQLFAFGLIIHIVLSTIINIGMVLGLLPIVGIPLPLISYGVSNLWVTFASLGICQSVLMHRYYTM
ncbi:rod shape-determining protein RodA [Candidatus Dependentiae bacterium]|nr:MAG: rod shape-determining protein RodA [Candidatus Dependentiae bacterium]